MFSFYSNKLPNIYSWKMKRAMSIQNKFVSLLLLFHWLLTLNLFYNLDAHEVDNDYYR